MNYFNKINIHLSKLILQKTNIITTFYYDNFSITIITIYLKYLIYYNHSLIFFIPNSFIKIKSNIVFKFIFT